MGAVTPLGNTLGESWRGVVEGRSGAGRITLFDIADCSTQIACEAKGFDVARAVGPFHPAPGATLTQACNSKEARRIGRYAHLGLAAGIEAYGDSGLDSYRDRILPERMGVNIGVGMGGLGEIEEVHKEFLAKGYRRITPFFITQTITNMVSGELSIRLNLQGPNLCNVTACTSSAHAMGESFRQIQRGDVDVMLAGGSEATICPLGIGGFAAMRALSTRNDDPTAASRPFDSGRDGFVMGEGGAAMILEEYEHAKRRGARIYGEILGYGLTGDAYHITTPAPEGEGGRRAMTMALRDSHLNPEEINYVNAHGTSTPAGDAEEARAVAKVFPNGADHLQVSSTKSMTGHLLGAAGAIEGIFCLLSIRDGVIPPTINLQNLDPACAETGLNFTANVAARRKVDYALSNSFGFGGTNASLIFGRI